MEKLHPHRQADREAALLNGSGIILDVPIGIGTILDAFQVHFIIKNHGIRVFAVQDFQHFYPVILVHGKIADRALVNNF